jgi:hypothetical protein
MHGNAIAAAGALGLGLCGAIVGSRLLVATYGHDVATLCNAEAESGFLIGRNAARVTTWTQEHMRTPEGGYLLAALRNLPVEQRATWLEGRALAAGFSSCPTARSYRELSRRWIAKEDLQHLCSTATFPDFEKLDGPARLQAIAEWFDAHAPTDDAHLLASYVLEAKDATGRAERLREAAIGSGILTCDIAKILPVPVATSCGPGP